MDCQFTFDQESGKVPISASMGPEFIMASKLYKHCPLMDVELGKMLVRPNLFFVEELSKKSLLTQERYGEMKRCYVICEEDETMEEEFQRYNIEKSPPDDVISIAGAGHMVMLSKPQQLCSLLLDLAQKY
ncbi:hypothetical protein CASFOL_005807 [Castilleja foliolosa]|uniref:Uncharacterized protein n=1 Tax=Castilleja foliolosa TaxID=1961234 RepID=A0ABD3E8H0_9LAMI